MKKIILLFTIALSMTVVNAQDNDAFQKDAVKLVETLSKSAFNSVVNQYVSMVSEDKQADFKKEVEATFPDLFKAIAKIYMDEFTHDEVKDILAFYATPIGKKMADKSGVMSQKGMSAGQEWGLKLVEILGKYK
jgi:hypothetical protein